MNALPKLPYAVPSAALSPNSRENVEVLGVELGRLADLTKPIERNAQVAVRSAFPEHFGIAVLQSCKPDTPFWAGFKGALLFAPGAHAFLCVPQSFC